MTKSLAISKVGGMSAILAQMPTSASTLKTIRQLHRYLGIFIAPSLLFFALTGAMQTLSLHETSKGSSYKPTTFLATMAQIHKNQTWMLKKPQASGDKPKADKADRTDKADKPAEAAAKAPDAAPAQTPTPLPTGKWKLHLPLKIFFLVVAFGLLLSTLSGIFMALKYGGSKLVTVLLLFAGVVIPIALLPF